MYRHLLIATDGSELSNRAVRQGLELSRALRAQATLVTVTEPWDAILVGEAALAFPPDEYEQSAAANAAGIMSHAKDIAAEVDMVCETLHVKNRRPAEGIIETAQAKGLRPDCDGIAWSCPSKWCSRAVAKPPAATAPDESARRSAS